MTATTAVARTQPGHEDPRASGERMIRLVTERGYLAEILGSDHATIERFKTVLLNALTGNDKLLRADPASLVQAMREAAMWGLEPDGVDAVIVPYWNSKRSIYEADFQPTARGYIRALYRSPRIRFVNADVVYEHDAFEYEQGSAPRLVHKPAIFGDRGKRLGAYAVAVLDSGFARPLVLNEDAITSRRKRARDPEKGTWAEWPDEMARKTAIRALISTLPIERGVKEIVALEDHKYEALPEPAAMTALAATTRPAPTGQIEAARQAFLPDPGPVDEPEPIDGNLADELGELAFPDQER